MANQSNQSFVISDDEILRKNTIDTNQIEILDIVGKGNFGIVNKGKQKFSEVRPRRIYNMAIPVVEFSNQGYKIRKIFA